ncbi:MAG: 5,10-methylenetetrahydromethanopterin reductase [Candidatus Heimdallarchaeota archaeon LC_3]|nr:MAG: 5,10-methylenetetrahydromethanopterin reductase [Candidatus Heimdallarchaeota archaeon LC_3]
MTRLGVFLSPDYVERKVLIDFISAIEDGGYEAAFVPEIWGRDAFTFITQLADNTTKLKLGTGIVNLYSRSPATLAMTAASLAEISNGRFILGLGLSGPIVIEQFHGIPYDKPLTRTREAIEIIRTLLKGERLNHHGKIFDVQRFRLSIKELKHNVPIYLASLGPKNLELTGEIADGWFPIWMTPESLPKMMESINKGLNKANKSRNSFTIAPAMIVAASDDPSVRDLARGHIAYYVGGMGDFYYNLMVRQGYKEVADKIQTAWKNKERKKAAEIISDELIDDLAVVGTPEEVKQKLDLWRALGIDLPLISLPYGTPFSIAMETLQSLAPNR